MVNSEFNRILVPLDGSPISEQVLTPVTSLAYSTGSSIVLVQVVPTGGSIRRMAAHPFGAQPDRTISLNTRRHRVT